MQISNKGVLQFGNSAQPEENNFNLSALSYPLILSGQLAASSTTVLHYRVSDDVETIKQVGIMVSEESALSDFQPNLAVIATWQMKVNANDSGLITVR